VTPIHRFCQFDFPFQPGPADGRYLLRGDDDVADVISVRTVGAELKRKGLGRRPHRRPTPAEAGEQAEPVTVTRVTVIRGQAFEDADAARDWLARCGKAENAAREVGEAVRLLNRAIHAHRVSAADPYVGDVNPARARRIRLGYGAGDDLVEGRWGEAYDVPAEGARVGRRRMLAPEEQLARILGGRRPVYPSEDMLLRARLDFDQGRDRTAALQANAACAAFEAEQPDKGVGQHAQRLQRLATAAAGRELTEDEIVELGGIIVELERLARRRRHAADER
jgi:hypothetical protein